MKKRILYPGWDSNPHRMVFETIASYLLGYRGVAAPSGTAGS